MCLILTVVFLFLSIQAAIENDWPFTVLYSLLSIFFIWLLVNNIRAVLKHRGKCANSGCSPFNIFKRSQKKGYD